VLEWGGIVLDAETHRVTRDGHLLKLGPTEFRLLAALIEKPGRVLVARARLDRVWGRDIYVDTRTVDVHVGRLRKALMADGGDDPSAPSAARATRWAERRGAPSWRA
jgi:two-component system phosphate regulon response regulator PhoB